MKKRSHVLHELLAGCVQRKDVECLRQHLTPKHEYVLFVRLSPLQVCRFICAAFVEIEIKQCRNKHMFILWLARALNPKPLVSVLTLVNPNNLG